MRECGECVVCCVYPRIDDGDLQKPPMTHCPHLTLPGEEKPNEVYYTGKGCTNCTVNDTKPQGCRKYRCAWLCGYGDEGDRPDKSLMLFDNASGIENALEAKPLSYGREDTEKARAVVERMSRDVGMPVVVFSFYERTPRRVVGSGV